MKHPRGFMFAMVAAGAAALAVFVLYWPVRKNGFVADDWVVVVELGKTIATMSWWEALVRPPAEYSVLFRPLPMLTFLLQLWAGQNGPEPFHLVNIVIHAANVFLLSLVAWVVLRGESPRRMAGLAALCGMVYGIHPAIIESAAWISARPDLVMTFLMCLALLGDRLFPERGWSRALAVGACFLAAMLSKETAVGLLAALPLVHLGISGERWGARDAGTLIKAFAPHCRVYAVLLVAFVLYLCVRFAVAGPAMGLEEMRSPARYIESFRDHLLVVAATFSYQIWTALWPFQNFVPSRQLPLPIDVLQMVPAATASAGAIALAFWAACRSGAGRVPALLFLSFVAALIPVANIVPIPAVFTLIEVAIAPRYLTFPLIFACLAVPFCIRLIETRLVRGVFHRRCLLWMIVGVWMAASAAFVRVTIPLWTDDLSLYVWTLRHAPSFWRYGNIGAHYVREGDLLRARESFTAAVALRDDEHSAWIWHTLGAVEASLDNPAQALRALRRAIELSPDNARARVLLAAIQRESGDSQMAVEILEEGLSRIRASGRPDDQERLLHYELGLAYADLGRTDDAIAQLNTSIELARGDEEHKTFEAALKLIAPRR